MRARKVRHLFSHTTIAICSLVIAIITVGLLWWDIGRQPVLSENFVYNVDTITSEVYFNPNSDKPQPSLYTQTNFEQSFAETGNQPSLRTSIGTTSSEGRRVTQTTETPVHAQDGTYTNTNAPQYVMAPRGIAKGEGFTYRHPTVATPVPLDFQRAETVSNLELYVYKGEVSDTASPAHTSDGQPIPLNHSLQTISQIELWVEPLSGWIVKSHVNRASKIIDTSTREQVHPYSHIMETMTQESIAHHLTHAKELRVKYAFAWQVAPGVLFGLFLSGTIIFLVTKLRRHALSVYGASAAVIEIAGIILVGWLIGAPLIVTFFSGYPAVNPLVSVWFIAVAIAMIALYKEKRLIAATAGSFVAVTSLTQLLGAFHIVSFSLDLVIFRDAITSINHIVSGSIPLFTSFMFLLLGISLIKAGFNSPTSRVHFAQFLVSIVCVFGIIGILLKVTLIDSLLVNFTQSFPLVQSLLFVICSYILVQQFRKLNGQPNSIIDTIQTLRRPFFATLPVILIITGAQIAINDSTDKLAVQFKTTTSSFEKSLAETSESYAHLIGTVRGFFAASVTVTDTEFQQFATSAIPRYEQSVVALGYAHATDPHSAPITYISTQQPSKYIGYNLFSDPSLSSTLEYVSDRNRTIMSPPSNSFGNIFTTSPYSIIITPIYKNNSSITDIAQRRAALLGYAFVVIDLPHLLETLANKLDGINVVVYDGINKGVGTMLYAKQSQEAVHEHALSSTSTLLSVGRPWVVQYQAQSTFTYNPQQTLAAFILLGGSLFYFMILALYFLLGQAKRNNSHNRG